MSLLLEVKDLNITFRNEGQENHAVKGVSFTVNKGETVALVGESGSGKSITALSSVQLLPDSASVSGSVAYEGQEMVGADKATLRRVRGNDISFIFQEPMTSLNPLRPDHRASGSGRHRRSGQSPLKLPAPIVRRSTPARDDRHGLGKRSRLAGR